MSPESPRSEQQEEISMLAPDFQETPIAEKPPSIRPPDSIRILVVNPLIHLDLKGS